MSTFTFLFAIMFVAAQGFAVVSTALIVAKFLGITRWFGKIAAVLISYAGWITFTLIGYAIFGGEGGFMDGFGLMLMLCFTALLSSMFWTAAWFAAPSTETAPNG